MKLGISSWTYPWAVGVPGYELPAVPLDAMGLLAKAQSLEVQVLQIADNLPLDRMHPSSLRRLKEAADEWGIALEVGTRGIQPDRMLRYLEIAKVLGAKILRTLLHAPDCSPDLETAASWISQVLPRFVEADVTIALENYERNTAAELGALIRKIGGRCLGICLDTVNNLGALETPEQLLAELGPYVVNLHIKDFGIERIDTRMGFVVTGRPAGQGLLNVGRILGELRDRGIDCNVILEQWPPFMGTIAETIAKEEEWAKESVRFLRELLR